MNEEKVEEYVKGLRALSEAFGIEEMPQADQEEFFGELSRNAVEAAVIKARMSLSAEDRAAFDSLFSGVADNPHDEAKAQALESFFQEKLPQFDQLVLTELAELAEQFEAMKDEVQSEEEATPQAPPESQ